MIRERMAIQRKRAQEREAEQHAKEAEDTGPAGLELMPDTPSASKSKERRQSKSKRPRLKV